MKIDFEITNTPSSEHVNIFGIEAYILYLEGTLRIYIGDKLFFDEHGILLIEFARSVHNWLQKVELGSLQDYLYETMDYDHPILSLKYIRDKLYKIDSIWRRNEINELIDKKQIISAFERYLNNLDYVLQKKFHIKLSYLYDR